MIGLSPGLVYGCFELLSIVSRNTLTFSQINTSFAHIGSMAAHKVIEAAQRLNWLYSNEKGIAILTQAGQRLLMLSSYKPMLRQALLDFIDIECPPWVQNATFGRSRVLSFASSEIAQIFVEADLAYGITDDVITFWDALAARARGQKCDRLTEIGRQGERLTIEYEETRTGRKPKWVAIDNNDDGYDVLSVVAPGDARYLSIEVKATTMGAGGFFHLTRHEWERSLETDNHVFHLWTIRTGSKPYLAIIVAKEMQRHIPSDLGLGCWEDARIPFEAFKGYFQAIPM
jgi:uncharacterized protein DUF3883